VSAQAWIPAYVGLGSNLDDPRARIAEACASLAGLPGSRFVLRSSLYRTPPFGPVAQPDFVNAVAALLTQLPPHELLASLNAKACPSALPPSCAWFGTRN